MKIAIIGPYFYPQVYGIEKVMYNHARHLAMRGHEVHVLTSRLRYPEGVYPDVPECEKREGFQIHRVRVLARAPVRPFSYPSNGGFLLSGVTPLLEQIQPDVLHAHNVGAASWAFLSARYARKYEKRFLYSTYFHPGRQKLDAVRKVLMRGLNVTPLKVAKAIFHQTTEDFDHFSAEFPHADRKRFAVLANGVEPPRYEPKPQTTTGPVNVLFVGRVDDTRKGFDVLSAAMRQVWAKHPDDVALTVVGQISAEKRAQIEAEYGAKACVLGPVSEDELERQYAAADIFVMPSLYEGFGMPFIEAMRYQIPVIGTRIGGIPEVVPEGTGLLVPVGDVRALTKTIHDLVCRADLRLEIGKQGKCWSEHFHWDQIINQLESHYQEAH